MTKFLLDSGDPDEYRKISGFLEKHGIQLWGSTTNPSLIAKKLKAQGEKISSEKAFELQKQIVLEILSIVPGAVSAEVYADEDTKAEEMIKQGLEISKWDERIAVKLPTNIEGFKARTALRQQRITTNNTLVFSQEQVFAICLHERLIQKTFGPIEPTVSWPSFISPFVGRLDDIGLNGMDLIANSMKMKKEYDFDLWVLEASIRTVEHIQKGMDLGVEIMTVPGKALIEWVEQTKMTGISNLKPIPYWQPPERLLSITTIEQFMEAVGSGELNIRHELTDKGIQRFAKDWQEILR